MKDDYGQNTYNILSKLIKFTFSKYLKDSGIELENIYQMKNLKTETEFYLLEVNGIQIRFKTQKEFLFHFMTFLKNNLEYYDKTYKKLTSIQIDTITDEIGHELRYKQIDYFKSQQTELFKVMKEQYDKSKNI